MLRAFIFSGRRAPASSRKVGAKSIRLTKSSTTRCAPMPGPAAISATRTPKSYRLHLPRGNPGAPWSPFEFAALLQFFQELPDVRIEGLHFTEIIGEIFTHLRNVRQE